MRACLVAVLAVGIMLMSPAAFCLVHVARGGETLEQLAGRYYGKQERSIVIRAANGFVHPDDGSLTRGELIEIPEVTYYQVVDNDSWETIANRFLGSPQRGSFLAEMNGFDIEKFPPRGMIIKIPYHLRHIFAVHESLKSVAKLYYNKKRKANFLMKYNLTRSRQVKRGSVVIVPLMKIELTKEERERVELAKSNRLAISDFENQSLARESLFQLNQAQGEGNYVEMVAIGQRMVGAGNLTVPQEIGVNYYLGYAYVALREIDSARKAFKRALELQPSMELSPITTSPKILDVFREARKEVLKKDTQPEEKK
jgi:tetratricopeptide (TPR) repeat protein